MKVTAEGILIHWDKDVKTNIRRSSNPEKVTYSEEIFEYLKKEYEKDKEFRLCNEMGLNLTSFLESIPSKVVLCFWRYFNREIRIASEYWYNWSVGSASVILDAIIRGSDPEEASN